MDDLIPTGNCYDLQRDIDDDWEVMAALLNEPDVSELSSPNQQVNGQHSMILQQKSLFAEESAHDQEDNSDDDSISSLSEQSDFNSSATESDVNSALSRNPPMDNNPSENGSRKRERSNFKSTEKGTVTTTYCSLRMRPLTSLVLKRELAEVVHAAVYGDAETEKKYPELIQQIRVESHYSKTFPYRTLKSVKTFVYNPFCTDYVKQSARLIDGVWVFSVCVRNDWSCFLISANSHALL